MRRMRTLSGIRRDLNNAMQQMHRSQPPAPITAEDDQRIIMDEEEG